MLLEDAAAGRFPPADGTVDVLPAPPGRSDAVVAFTARHVVAAGIPSADVLAQLSPDDLGAPMAASFLTWLGARLRSEPGSLDLVLAAPGDPGADTEMLVSLSDAAHERVSRAERYREEIQTFTDPRGVSVVIFGRGLAHRREVSIELDEAARDRGFGRQLLRAARGLIPPDEFLFAQVAAGNAASLRSFAAAGFVPIGAEVLFLRAEEGA
jgi:GNAT superfamily N-acetyltransferase